VSPLAVDFLLVAPNKLVFPTGAARLRLSTAQRWRAAEWRDLSLVPFPLTDLTFSACDNFPERRDKKCEQIATLSRINERRIRPC
jgi:hypothetical protein